MLNHVGLIVDWDVATANVYDGSQFQQIAERHTQHMVLFSDEAFVKKDWHPENLKICKRGEWNTRMIVETVLSILTLVCHFKKVMHRAWTYFKTRVGFTLALFNILVQWYGLPVEEDGFVPLSIAEFSL